MKVQYYHHIPTAITENPTETLIKLNRLLANLTRSHQYTDSFKLFHQIHASHRLRPDHYTLSTALAATFHHRNTLFGSQLHTHALKTGLKSYSHVANTLLSLYAKSEDLESVKWVFGEMKNPDVYSWTTLLSACTKLGQVGYACKMFDEMPERSVEVWNAVITGCAENGYAEIAFDLFVRMHRVGVRHDNYTFASVLSLCCLDFGRQVHSLVIRTGFLGRASVVNAQLTMYFSWGNVEDAYEVFEEAEGRVHDQITYNAMIAGLVSVGRDEEALIMFVEMQNACLRPTERTFVSVISSCSSARIGHQVHAQAIKMGFEMFTSVSNAAVTMYSSCGDLISARVVFERLEEKDLISWNTMITSYAQENLCEAATLAYVHMLREGIEPDEFTIGSLLASSESIEIDGMIQALVIKNGLIFKIEVSNALISAFSKHGKMKQAYEIFSDMSPKNLISWNTVISSLLLNGFAVQGLKQLSLMLLSGLRPNAYTLSIVLSICACISSLRHGKQVHGYLLRQGLFSETLLGNALITMYAKSGVLDSSLRVFNTMIDKDTVSWNSLISAYAQHGEGKRAVHSFEAMLDSDGVKPDQATFTSVLSACSHAGLVDDGTRIFNSMVNIYGLEPGIDHFSCIVDLLGRAGYLDEAERLINGKHIQVDLNTWWALFGSCAAHGNLRLGRIVAEFLLDKEQNNPAVYVQLANIYANAGQWEEAATLREMMKRHGVMKQPGRSWIRT
ncbi:LOW QUALITY PROTEIN: pentatricopeptide repeat-containing protein At3g49740-like [Actinidia eriantha]|uniref:LOW QUALITY PROTEIN: pentatricopeptide repeat-containing protein At3g49740-like n=1 Tax=Actinidia eriantha TaxID=165200 RepID=UPI00258868EE|nr:LOW QUALITY PROTEIN: pentatricopeptide repeat-containing protein At3g49740-like [Actinidia eriantha]